MTTGPQNTEKSDILYYGVALSIFCYMESLVWSRGNWICCKGTAPAAYCCPEQY